MGGRKWGRDGLESKQPISFSVSLSTQFQWSTAAAAAAAAAESKEAGKVDEDEVN